MKITAEMIESKGYWSKQETELCKKVFPYGFDTLIDMDKAAKAGLDVFWIAEKFKLSGIFKIYFQEHYGDISRNGSLACEYSYINGKLHGICRGYYDNGTLLYERGYNNGKDCGFCRVYARNGAIAYECKYDNLYVIFSKKFKNMINKFFKKGKD
jgi:antitoxin component YwqK of YwqJK toxin-antitoxin module